MASQPTAMDVHVDVPLSNVSVAFFADNQNYMHRGMFATVPVVNKSDKFWQFPRGKLLRPTARVRSPGSESAGGGFDLNPGGYYSCDVWGLHKDIDDIERSNSDPGIDIERMTTRYLAQQIDLTLEQQFMAKYMQPGVWTNSVNPQTPWDQAGSTPIADLRQGIKVVTRITGGFKPNKIGFSEDVWTCLQDHPDFLSRVALGQNGNPSMVNQQLLASLLGVTDIVIGDAVYNTAVETNNEGAPIALSQGTFQFMAPPHVLICYAAPEPGLAVPSAGYRFEWSGYTGMSNGSRMLKYRIDKIHSDRLEIEAAFTMGLVSADCGYLLQNVVTPT